MKISNTDVEAQHPWPEGTHVQGGSAGIVLRPVERGGNYRTAFVEAFPAGTFIRGEGETVEAAEDACWAEYQKIVNCDGGGEHGPYEPRHYENGAGFCVKCDAWFSNVCEPSLGYGVNALACKRVQARWGRNVVLTEKWRGLVADEEAGIWALIRHEPMPSPTTADPTPEELRDCEPPSPEELARQLVLLDIALGRLIDSAPRRDR